MMMTTSVDKAKVSVSREFADVQLLRDFESLVGEAEFNRIVRIYSSYLEDRSPRLLGDFRVFRKLSTISKQFLTELDDRVMAATSERYEGVSSKYLAKHYLNLLFKVWDNFFETEGMVA